MIRLSRMLVPLLALLALLAIVVGIPVALIAFVGSPIPDPLPTGAELGDIFAGRTPIPAEYLISGLAIVMWFLWIQAAWATVVESLALLHGRLAQRVRMVPGMQLGIAKLVTAATLLATSFSAKPAAAGSLMPVASLAAEDRPVTTPQIDAKVLSGLTRQTDAVTADTTSPGDTRWDLAEDTLGSGTRWKELRSLNLGRTMEDGSVISAGTDLLRPNWRLLLPTSSRSVSVDSTENAGTDSAGADGAGTDGAGTDSAVREVVVQPGDTIWEIAEDDLDSRQVAVVAEHVDEIAELNREILDGNPDLIYPGQELSLPAAPGSGDSTPDLAPRPPAPPRLPTAPESNSDADSADGTDANGAGTGNDAGATDSEGGATTATTAAASTTVAPGATEAPQTDGVPETTASETSSVPQTTSAPPTTEAPRTTKAPRTTEAPRTTKVPQTTTAPQTSAAETTKPPVTTPAPAATDAPDVSRPPATTAPAAKNDVGSGDAAPGSDTDGNSDTDSDTEFAGAAIHGPTSTIVERPEATTPPSSAAPETTDAPATTDAPTTTDAPETTAATTAETSDEPASTDAAADTTAAGSPGTAAESADDGPGSADTTVFDPVAAMSDEELTAELDDPNGTIAQGPAPQPTESKLAGARAVSEGRPRPVQPLTLQTNDLLDLGNDTSSGTGDFRRAGDVMGAGGGTNGDGQSSSLPDGASGEGNDLSTGGQLTESELVASQSPGQSDQLDTESSRAPIFFGLAGLTLLGGYLYRARGRRRDTALRHRHPGRRPVPPKRKTRGVARRLAAAAQPEHPEFVNVGLRALGRQLQNVPAARLPKISGVWVSHNRLVIALADDSPRGTPPEPFTEFADGSGWSLRRADFGHAKQVAKGANGPLPLLTTIGTTTALDLALTTNSRLPAEAYGLSSSLLFAMDLEAGRVISVRANDEASTIEALTMMALELATSETADQAEIVCVGFGHRLATFDRVMVVEDISEILSDLETISGRAVYAAADASPFATRVGNGAADTWNPVIVFHADEYDPHAQTMIELAAQTEGGVTAVCGYPANIGWTLRVDGDRVSCQNLPGDLSHHSFKRPELDGVELIPDLFDEPWGDMDLDEDFWRPMESAESEHTWHPMDSEEVSWRPMGSVTDTERTPDPVDDGNGSIAVVINRGETVGPAKDPDELWDSISTVDPDSWPGIEVPELRELRHSVEHSPPEDGVDTIELHRSEVDPPQTPSGDGPQPTDGLVGMDGLFGTEAGETGGSDDSGDTGPRGYDPGDGPPRGRHLYVVNNEPPAGQDPDDAAADHVAEGGDSDPTTEPADDRDSEAAADWTEESEDSLTEASPTQDSPTGEVELDLDSPPGSGPALESERSAGEEATSAMTAWSAHGLLGRDVDLSNGAPAPLEDQAEDELEHRVGYRTEDRAEQQVENQPEHPPERQVGNRPQDHNALADIGAVADPGFGSEADAAIRVSVLGNFTIEGHHVGDRSKPWKYTKTPELVLYLLLHPGGASQDLLMEQLFPEQPPNRPRLNQLVSDARTKALGKNCDGDYHLPHASPTEPFYKLLPSVGLDLRDFAQHCANARKAESLQVQAREWEAALTLVRGRPFTLPNEGYEWAIPEIEATIIKVEEAAVALTDIAMELGDHRLAVWATKQGLLTETGYYELLVKRGRAALLLQDPEEIVRAFADLQVSLEYGGAPEEGMPDLTSHPELEDVYNELSSEGRNKDRPSP